MNNEYDIVNNKIAESKIFRFPYKKWLGESLTSFITRNDTLSYEQIREKLLKVDEINTYLRKNPSLYVKFFENLKVSYSARKAEQKTYTRRKEQ